LDFLGFSRANRDLSMGYAGKTAKEFFVPFSPLGRSKRRKGRPPATQCGSAEVFIEQA
jgi:hypothetical protein